MQHCPYCGCDSLIKNGSTRGVPKWRCKTCGRQTSLKGDHTETDRQHDQARSEAVLLYLSGLSLTAIGFLKSVVPSTILRWVRRFAQQRAAKPHPDPGGVIVMEIDEVWHFVGNKKNKLWIWLAFCRDTGQLVDWGVVIVIKPHSTGCCSVSRPGRCFFFAQIATHAMTRL